MKKYLVTKIKGDKTIEKELTEGEILELIEKGIDLESLNISIILEENEKYSTISESNVTFKLRHYIVDSFLANVEMYLIMNGQSGLTTAEQDELAKLFLAEGYPQSNADLEYMVERAKDNAKAKSKDKKKDKEKGQEVDVVVGGKPQMLR